MIRVIVDDFKEYVDFLSLTDTEYVDVFLDKGIAYFVCSTPELFGMLTLRAVIDTEEEINYSFRVPRNTMIKLGTQGVLLISVDTDIVNIDVTGSQANVLWSFSFRRQGVYTSEYIDKIKLCSTLKNYTTFSMQSIYPIVRYARPFNAIITVNKGLATAFIDSRVRLCKRVKLQDNISISSNVLNKLLKFSFNVCHVRNYLAAASQRVVLLATLCMPADFPEFEILEEQKSAMKCKLSLANIFDLFNKMDFKTDTVSLDFNSKLMLLEKNRVTYKVPLSIQEMQCSPAYKPEILTLNLRIVKNLLSKISSEYRLEKRQTCLRLQCEDLIIYL